MVVAIHPQSTEVMHKKLTWLKGLAVCLTFVSSVSTLFGVDRFLQGKAFESQAANAAVSLASATASLLGLVGK